MPNSVWTYDFIHDRLASGTALKILCVLDEHTRECLASEVGRWMRSHDVILTLSRLMKLHGKPQFIRSDNGAEFTAKAVIKWLRDQNISRPISRRADRGRTASSRASTASCATSA